jgi:hypothetical protein
VTKTENYAVAWVWLLVEHLPGVCKVLWSAQPTEREKEKRTKESPQGRYQ